VGPLITKDDCYENISLGPALHFRPDQLPNGFSFLFCLFFLLFFEKNLPIKFPQISLFKMMNEACE
jgi:hypothetical protein